MPDFAHLKVYCPCSDKCKGNKGNRNSSPRRCNYEGHAGDFFTGYFHTYRCPACQCIWTYKQESIQIGEDRIAEKKAYPRCR